ncbi:MAG: ATP synthase F1 subunit gamma [Ruminococcaceae bacterium]|nr:ATP synthase F1 subunit gamma [Oscillospiraceae bacterium]
MAGNTKALRVRIKSVTSTLQLTKAMELVASSKIRRANEAMNKGREYKKALEKTVTVLSADGDCQKSPYMQKRDTGRVRIVIIAGDRGLAGGYNANVFRLAREYPEAQFIPIGKRACERYSLETVSSEHFSFGDAARMAEELCRDFREGEFDRLGVIWTEYISVMSQEARITWLLPFEKGEGGKDSQIIFEPDALTVLNNTVSEYVAGMITVLCRESYASEVAARRMAMDSAGKNASQMIDDLQLEYNRARQGAITQEITEIVAGSGV